MFWFHTCCGYQRKLFQSNWSNLVLILVDLFKAIIDKKFVSSYLIPINDLHSITRIMRKSVSVTKQHQPTTIHDQCVLRKLELKSPNICRRVVNQFQKLFEGNTWKNTWSKPLHLFLLCRHKTLPFYIFVRWGFQTLNGKFH